MTVRTLSDSRAWRAGTIDKPDCWYYPVSERCLAALEQTIQDLRRKPRPVTELRVEDTPCAQCQADFLPVLEALEAGRGFAIITGVPLDRWSIDELQACYWLIGQLLGKPLEQNVQGALLYDVKDTGQDVRYGARFSVTNNESSFHTDNSFGSVVADYVGLFCLRTAKSGGVNQVVSVYALNQELEARHPEELRSLAQPYHVDRRGGVLPGEAATVAFPVLAWQGKELLCRYLRYWIEVGQEKVGAPLAGERKKALDVLDALASDKKLQAEFSLKPGDMFFINNRWLLHNRTAFEDFDEPEKRRHYVRLWLQADSRSDPFRK